ncbi:Alcohol dehydrogenase GroES domain protein [Candidatus Desulfosporosinus infrequens]|uniref:Alcohol dehydrogenase GroES domain protein n=1 Tax=Candidatus Desulfosporosinus infrequens TaxID=2043169 RepID=A0A2U3LPZ1_9FIRM|nr:Alcohol dehydrogenase GroES domain protein [Candidatus Desulfosporosinus infrequens]
MFELYLNQPGDLVLREANALPAAKKDEVKLKIIYGGICGSDLKVYKGLISYAAYPLRPGHEVLGRIIEVGENVPYEIGTRVVVFPNTFCGVCEYCLQEKTNICIDKQPIGVSSDGVFAEEVIIESKYIVPIPEEIADEKAILIEPFAVTIHALKKANIRKGNSVAIIGCGTEGLFSVAIAKKLGAKVTIIDINANKWEIAKRLDENVRTIHPKDVKGELFDVVIEAAGVPASIEQSMEIVKPGGCIVAIGITCDPVNYPSLKIVRSEVSIFGSIIYTLKDFTEAIGYLKDPKFDLSPVLSKIVPYTDFHQAFDDAMGGNFAKIALKF